MIAEVLNIIKKNLFLISLIFLVALLSFQLGRISKSAGQPIQLDKASIQEIFNDQNNTNTRIYTNNANRGEERIDFRAKSIQELNRSPDSIEFRVVASKKSTSGKYHFLWCPGAKQIKEENKIYFNSEEEAITAGFSLAGNCSK